MKVDGNPCGNDDVDRDRCAACVWEHSSFFGVVSIEGWREQWASLLGCAGVDLRDLDETLAGAVRRVYGHELYGTDASGAL